MRGHPSTEQIRRFLDVQEARRSEWTALHLLECESCRATALRELEESGGQAELLAKVLRHPAARGPLEGVEPPAGLEPPAAADERLLTRLSTAIEEVNACGDLLAELRRHPVQRWRLLFDNSDRYRSLALARELIDIGHREAFDDPGRGAAMVELVVDLVDHLDSALYGDRLLDDVRARGWAMIGDCYRMAGDLRAADSAFRRSARLIEDSPDTEELATHLYLLGVLRKDQRRSDDAIRCYNRARRLSEEIGDSEKVARILTSLGNLQLQRSQPEEALSFLLDAQALLDDRSDSRLALFVRVNLANCLVELGDYPGARALFEPSREQYSKAPDSYVRLRTRWLEGRIAIGLGEEEQGERTLVEVRAEYLERGLHYDVALVSLNLAALYARQGRMAELKVLAEEMTAIFLAQEIPAEVMAALAFLRQAVEQDRATEELVGGVARFLQRAQSDPSVRFRRR
jgi:tetratricopeptide (TPR) repeat protein